MTQNRSSTVLRPVKFPNGFVFFWIEQISYRLPFLHCARRSPYSSQQTESEQQHFEEHSDPCFNSQCSFAEEISWLDVGFDKMTLLREQVGKCLSAVKNKWQTSPKRLSPSALNADRAFTPSSLCLELLTADWQLIRNCVVQLEAFAYVWLHTVLQKLLVRCEWSSRGKPQQNYLRSNVRLEQNTAQNIE